MLTAQGFSLSTCVLNGLIYAIDGTHLTMEAYDLSNDTWQSKGSIPINGTAAVVNGILYLVTGSDSSGVHTVATYNSVANSWTTQTSTGVAYHYGFSMDMMNGLIYTVGGFLG